MAGKCGVITAIPVSAELAKAAKPSAVLTKPGILNVRAFGATGDGSTIDGPAIHCAIDAAVADGGGTVFFPAGTRASYSIRLKSHVSLYLDQGATILTASTPLEGTTISGYDTAGPQNPERRPCSHGRNRPAGERGRLSRAIHVWPTAGQRLLHPSCQEP